MYKITFRLTSPCVFIDAPMFDAIIAYCWQQEYYPNEPQRLSIPESQRINFDAMPIIKHEAGFFLASRMFYMNAKEEVHVKRKKWDEQNDDIVSFDGKKRQIRVSGGQHKSYEIPRVAQRFDAPSGKLPFSPYGHVWFYFESNDLQTVKSLIDKHLHGIGKDVGQGKGRFDRYVVEEINDVFIPEKMRPVPVEIVNMGEFREHKEVRQFIPITPPYWEVSRAVECIYFESEL